MSSMREYQLNVGKYLISNKLGFRKGKKHTPEKPIFVSEQVEAIQTLSNNIEKLAEPCGWKLLKLDSKYNPATNSMSQTRFVLGVMNSNECTDEEDFVS